MLKYNEFGVEIVPFGAGKSSFLAKGLYFLAKSGVGNLLALEKSWGQRQRLRARPAATEDHNRTRSEPGGQAVEAGRPSVDRRLDLRISLHVRPSRKAEGRVRATLRQFEGRKLRRAVQRESARKLPQLLRKRQQMIQISQP